jgi:hypothetical protein
MGQNLIEVFDCEKQCEYKGRQYLVRDNGAVFRFQKEDVEPANGITMDLWEI